MEDAIFQLFKRAIRQHFYCCCHVASDFQLGAYHDTEKQFHHGENVTLWNEMEMSRWKAFRP